MNFKWHFITAVVFFVCLMFTFKAVTISLIVISILCVIIPDTDLRFGSHRHIALHSIIMPIFVLIFNWSLLTVLICLSFGLHLLCDIQFKKVGGTFTIKYFAQKSIGGFWFAEVWLIGNFIVSLIIFILYMVFV
jgi:hypothetical protein